jgi:hypothetical protein
MDIVNPNGRGEIAFSNDGRKIIIRQHCDAPKPFRVGDWVLCRYQTTGITPGVEVVIPEYARLRFWAGLHYEFMRFKDRYSGNDKELARQQMVMEDDNLYLDLNRLLLEPLAQLQDAPNIW